MSGDTQKGVSCRNIASQNVQLLLHKPQHKCPVVKTRDSLQLQNAIEGVMVDNHIL